VVLGARGRERRLHVGALGVIELAVGVLVELLEQLLPGRSVTLGNGVRGRAGHERRGDQQCEFQLGQHGCPPVWRTRNSPCRR